MIVDSHCHLDFPEFKDNIDQIIANAKENDVEYMQTICTHISKFPQILDIATKYDNIFCSIGNHPNHVSEEKLATSDEIIKLTQDKKVIGIGETGLDYYYDYAPKDLQQKSFINHIIAAQETNLPVIVHSRSADEDTLSILQEMMAKKPFKGLIHCFSTGKELAEGAINLGMSISISGIITFKKATDLQNIVKDLPLESLLVETDAPYLAPVPKRGKTNEPAFTKHTTQFLAELKNIPYKDVAETTTNNFFKLFSKAYR